MVMALRCGRAISRRPLLHGARRVFDDRPENRLLRTPLRHVFKLTALQANQRLAHELQFVLALRGWMRQAERDHGRRTGLATEERKRLKSLEREPLAAPSE